MLKMPEYNINRANFAKIPANLPITYPNLHLVVIPTLTTITRQFEAETSYSIASLLQQPIFPDPDDATIISNRPSQPPLFNPLDTDDQAYLELSNAERKEARELEPFRFAKFTHLHSKFRLFTIGQSLLRDELDKFIPYGHPYRAAIAGDPTIWQTMDFGEILHNTSELFLNLIDRDGERSRILATLNSTTFAIKSSEDLAAWTKSILNHKTLHDLLYPLEPLSERQLTNFMLNSIKKSDHMTQCPTLQVSLYTYEASHNSSDDPREHTDIIDMITSLLPTIINSSSKLRTIHSANSAQQPTSDNEAETSANNEQQALLATKSATKPAAKPKRKDNQLTSILSFMSNDSNLVKLQAILKAVNQTRQPSTNAAAPSSTAASTSHSAPATPSKYIKTRYCYSCGSTSGPTMHISRTCPAHLRVDHHDENCNWSNRSNYPRSAAP